MGLFDETSEAFLTELNSVEPQHDLGFRGTSVSDIPEPEAKEPEPADVIAADDDEEDDIDPVVTKDEPPSWARDIEQKINILGSQKFAPQPVQEQRQPEPQQQYQQRQPQRVATDVDLEYMGQKMAQLENLQQVTFRQAVNAEAREADTAYKTLVERYPDLQEYIKPEHIKQSLDIFVNQGQLGQPWMQKIEQSYFSMSGSKWFAEAQKAKAAKPVDQVAAKRKERSKQVAVTIPSAGGTHVPSGVSLTPNTRGFTDAARAFRAELDGTY